MSYIHGHHIQDHHRPGYLQLWPISYAQMRSILLVAEMSVLGRLGDAVAVRSLVSSRAADLLRCSTNLLRYCVQVCMYCR